MKNNYESIFAVRALVSNAHWPITISGGLRLLIKFRVFGRTKYRSFRDHCRKNVD